MMRARIATHGAIGSVVALAIPALGALLILNGDLAIGIVLGALAVCGTWLAGLWVVPGSVEAYHRRVGRILRDGAASYERVYVPCVEEMRATTSRLADQMPLVDIVGPCERIDALLSEDTVRFVDKMSRLIEHRRQLLEAHGTTNEVAELIGRRVAVISELPRLREAPATGELRKLEGVSAPLAVRERHEHYIRALSDAIASQRACVALFDGLNGGDGSRLLEVARDRARALGALDAQLREERRMIWNRPRRTAKITEAP